jgi:hypothetical protein
MQTMKGRALRATKPIRVQNSWTQADDAALVAGMLARNDDAWLEFFARFKGIIVNAIRSMMSRVTTALCTSEVTDTIVASVEAYLTADKMRALRAFNPRRGALSVWLARVAEQSTLRHLDELTSLDDEDGETPCRGFERTHWREPFAPFEQD